MKMEWIHLNNRNSPFYNMKQDIVHIEQVMYNRTYRFLYYSSGNQVVAYISFPIEFDISKQYPILFYNRGGRDESGKLIPSDIERFTSYNLIAVGSQYRGNDGGIGGKDEFGGDDIEDVQKLLDIMLRQSYIDLKKVFMVGMSRGGMMTYMMVRREPRICAIAVVSALSDLFQTWKARPEYHEVLMSYIGGGIEEKREEYIKRTAACWSNDINVPVLMFHSRFDVSVSFEQSENMRNLLIKNNKDIKLIEYEDDIHGFHENDIFYIMKWFNVI